MSVKFSRRELITQLKNLLASASLYPLLPSSVAAKDDKINMNEHFFIFVELRGGVHHLLATDYPHPDKIREVESKHAAAVMRFKIDANKTGFFTDPDISEDFKQLLRASSGGDSTRVRERGYINHCYAPNGYFIALPDGHYLHPTDSSKRLGWSGLPLADYVDSLGVLRGVCMRGNFHDKARLELYSGSNQRQGEHVAGVLAELLVSKSGGLRSRRPLDNLVLDGAEYAPGDSSTPPLRATFNILQALLGSTGSGASTALRDAEVVARALLQDLHLGGASGHERKIFTKFVDAFTDARAATADFGALRLDNMDISQNLYAQLETCLQLFQNNLARVVTVCMGATSQFGLFDSHGGLYHNMEVNDANGNINPLHYQKLHDAMSWSGAFYSNPKGYSLW